MWLLNARKSRAQSTAEYAVVVGFVVAAIVAMGAYVRRGLMSKVKVVTDNVGSGLLDGGFTPDQLDQAGQQYEPYYAKSDYNVSQTSDATEEVKEGYIVERTDIEEETIRASGGSEETGIDWEQDDGWEDSK